MQSFIGFDAAGAKILSESVKEFSPEHAPKVPEKDPYPSVIFFGYDDDYAREKRNDFKERLNSTLNTFLNFFMVIALIGALLYDIAIFETRLGGILLALLLCFNEFFLWTLFRGKKLLAKYRAFAVYDGILYMIKYTPNSWFRVALWGHHPSLGFVIDVDSETARVAKDKGVATLNIERALDEKSEYGYLKYDAYKRAKIVELKDIYPVLEMDSRITCQYADAKDKYRRVTILDCYPGLIEYIKSK